MRLHTQLMRSLMIVFATLLPVGITSGEVLLFEEWRNDFLGLGPDNVPDIGQGVHYAGGAVTNVLDIQSGQLWMRMDDSTPNDSYYVEYVPKQENPTATTYQLDYQVNTLSGTTLAGLNAFESELKFNTGSISLLTSDDGNLYVNDGSSFVNTGYAHAAGTSMDVSLTADTLTDTYSLEINDQIVLQNQVAGQNIEGQPRVFFSSNYPTVGAQELGYVELNDDYEAPNLLSNGSFELGLNEGTSVFLDGRGPGISSANDWTLFHNSSGSTESTRVSADTVGERLPGSGDSIMRIEASHGGNGLVQVFGALNEGPVIVESSAWVYVESGEVYLGTGNGGNTGADVRSTTTGRWELLKSRNGVWPANELILYSSGGSSLFYADLARVEVLDLELFPGDSTLDGIFDSSDLVNVFRAGKYDTGENASWEQGDWTGDGLFDSTDLVAAFRDGNYRSTAAAVAAVPEPQSASLLLLLAPLALLRRRQA